MLRLYITRMPPFFFIGIFIIIVDQINPVELFYNSLYTETEIQNQYLPQHQWVIVAIQKNDDISGDELNPYLCLYFNFVSSKENATCDLPTKNTTKGALKIVGGDELGNREFEKIAVVTVSAYAPEVFGDAVRHAVCDTVMSDESVSDFEIDKLFVVIARANEETQEEFDVNVGGHVLLVIVIIFDGGKKVYKTIIISRTTHSRETLETIVNMYQTVYLSQVPELQTPIPVPECYNT